MSGFNEAMRAACDELGWERAAFFIWPDRPLHRSEARLRACLDPDRFEKLTPVELLSLMRYAAEKGCHIIMETLCAETNYSMPHFWTREERLAEEMKRFIRLAEEVCRCGERVAELSGPFPFDEQGFAKAQAERADPKIVRRELARIRDEVWERLVQRDGETCSACGATENLTIDHIRPVTRGGDNSLDNLQILCAPCNSSKGDRYLEAVK